MRRIMRDCMPALCILYACSYAKLYVVHRGCPGGCQGNARGMLGGFQIQYKISILKSKFLNPFFNNHALIAQSLLSRFFSWDIVDVLFPTCFNTIWQTLEDIISLI
jgi:hypothetical protein